MILKKFHGSKINGYLDFDVEFFSDLTFLTGINGTGKTSALNAIASLLMPKLDFLATQTYDDISIVLEEKGESVVLQSVQGIDGAEISCSLYPADVLTIPSFGEHADFRTSNSFEREKEYYHTFAENNASHPVMKFILELPTPMFLGLDRRTRATDVDVNLFRYPTHRRKPQLRRQNVFSNSLSGSLNEAILFAERRISINMRKKADLDRSFRDELVLELLNFPPIDFEKVMADEEAVDPKILKSAKVNINKIPNLIGISGEKILKRIDELFEFIEDKRKIMMGPDLPPPEERPWEDPRFEARFILAHNKANIDKINTLSEMVNNYTESSEKIFSRINDFVKLINSFIADSGKTLTYDEGGTIEYRVGSESQTRDLRTLSSGEIQLIVIFAHLYFNPETEKANIFIIDEPELSLHVQWQEKFVDALANTSTTTQFVMATHSPTVIIGRTDHCKEITRIK